MTRNSPVHEFMKRYRLESPIEALLGIAIINQLHEADECLVCHYDELDKVQRFPQYVLISQYRWREFRIDWVLGDNRSRLAFMIECDGHDFHERTPEQAIRDRRRDRIIQASGKQVLRFTGREITSDADRCAQEIWECVGVAQFRDVMNFVFTHRPDQ